MNVTAESVMETVDRAIFGYSGGLESRFRRLIFNHWGLAKMASTVGVLYGMGAEDKLVELFQLLEGLDQYGGHDEANNLPAYKIRVGDDGLFGSFTLLWYRQYTPDLSGWNRETSYEDYLRTLKVDPELKDFASGGGYVHYKFAFNGGLIFHRGQSDDDRESILQGSWGIHT